ncbi:hypothetical protein F4778DRAFT_290983 [Xylariomycetidae sp. FL2044]|nr:hypothetical protein F4778DRAFT_290983 [Xylariomycetidae sp. FL2044]
MLGLGPSIDSPTTDSRGPALLAVSVTTTLIALPACILRYCVRARISRSVSWDDYFAGLAQLLGLVGVVFAIVEATSVGGAAALQYDYLAQPWLNMGSTLAEVSICLFVLRLVSRVRAWRAVLGAQVVALLAVNLAYSFASLLQCRPNEKLWKPEIAGRCWSLEIQQDIGYFQGAFDVFSQLFIALFPIMVIQDLGIPRNVRWPFYTLSVMSIIIAMLSVLRTYNISLIRSGDQFMFQIIATILKVLELNLGIVSANILPIASLCSKNIRPISQALSEAASARDDDAASIFSRRARTPSSLSKRQSNGSTFLIEGPQRASFEAGPEGAGAEAWPMGIIKTVSVEVTQENAADIEQGMDISDGRRISGQQDWDSYLR